MQSKIKISPLGKKILVTGGAGFVGSHSIVALVEAGYIPIIVDNFSNAYADQITHIEKIISKPLKVYRLNCCNMTALNNIFKVEKTISGILHFAAYKSVRESTSRPQKYYSNNLGAMAAIISAALKFKIKNFVYSSSSTVYGQPHRLPVFEDDGFKTAESPYGHSKQLCELALMDACLNSTFLKGVSLRYFNPIGAHPSGLLGEHPKNAYWNLVPLIMRKASETKPNITIFGGDYPTTDGTCVRDYIHVMDVANAHVRALTFLSKQPAHYVDAFNIGLGHGYSNLEILRLSEKISGKKIEHVVAARSNGDIGAIYADVRKAKNILKFKTSFTVESAIKNAWHWQQKLLESNASETT